MKKLRLGLFGLDYTSDNMGCQALAYSFLGILSNLLSKNKISCEVTFFLSKRNLESNTRPVGEYNNMSIQTIGFRDRQFIYLAKMIKRQDLCIHFTGGDSFSDLYGSRRFIIGSLQKSLVQFYHIPLILGPQTYGPFNNRIFKIWAKDIIKNAVATFTRDDLSYNRISTIKKANISLATDVAFSLQYDQEYYICKNDKKLFGINVSGLLYSGGYTKNNQFLMKVDYVDYCKRVIEYLHKQEIYDIYLVPHVIGHRVNNVDNDIEVSNMLIELYPFCKLAPEFRNPMEAKSFISSLDFFIGARMHATIAAFSTGVLTIPFSYSVKFEGLYRGLGFDYCINGCELSTDEALQKTILYIEQKDKLKKDLTKALRVANQRLDKFIIMIESIIFEYNEKCVKVRKIG